MELPRKVGCFIPFAYRRWLWLPSRQVHPNSGMRVYSKSTPISERPRRARAASTCLALSVALCACSRKTADLGEEPGAPTSATFQLAPGVVAAPKPADNVLAATAPDANPPSGVVGSSAAPPSSGEDAPAVGAPSPTCVNGWSIPERGSALRGAVLDMMRVRPGERFVVQEMRYFVGPEDAEVLGSRGDVERWYVKAFTETDPRRRLRWLVRRAPVGSGVDAIAPFESTGYGASTWRRPDAPDESLADPFERPCEGTQPGDKCTGLPREVLGCLSGT
jgi:hypothetical protein